MMVERAGRVGCMGSPSVAGGIEQAPGDTATERRPEWKEAESIASLLASRFTDGRHG